MHNNDQQATSQVKVCWGLKAKVKLFFRCELPNFREHFVMQIGLYLNSSSADNLIKDVTFTAHLAGQTLPQKTEQCQQGKEKKMRQQKLVCWVCCHFLI